MTDIGHTLGDVLEDMILGYSRRDTDGTRQGGDAKAAPVPKHCQAGAEGIAQMQSTTEEGRSMRILLAVDTMLGANAVPAPRHSAKPEPQSLLRLVPSGECRLSQGEEK